VNPPITDLEGLMARAVSNAAAVRGSTAPNPWVGAVLVTADGSVFDGATEVPGRRHAEIVALDAAGGSARDGTIVTTLEPCSHHGRTGPCADAIVAAGVGRVVIGLIDPDPLVGGRGIARLREAGIEVVTGVGEEAVSSQLEPYVHHRRTGRPFVTLKLAATLDGRTAMADGTSQWITGHEARADAHRLRARCDAILVGAATVRADDPALTVRHSVGVDPRRIVLGRAPTGARVHPCTEIGGPLPEVLDRLGAQGVIDLLVEGGARVAHGFHAEALVQHYVVYLAPALTGGDDSTGLFNGPGTATIADLWRGRIAAVTQLGVDLRIDLRPFDRGEC
jgi:diaminohydroxyphosphoribosylaminopyrimidine deaminase/5-amino-6-(5-phosphoribosylamino)uracil reductase